MSIKTLRQKRCISQEQLADLTGVSLRTIQRAESGEQVGRSTLQSLATFFEVEVEALKQEKPFLSNRINLLSNQTTNKIAHHRAAQLIIYAATFFICVSQWMAYYAYLNAGPTNASLSTILTYVAEMALGAAIFVYIFNKAKITFVWSYYIVAAAFTVCAIGIGYWTQPFIESESYKLFFPAFFTLMLLSLTLFHVLQLALSLRGETVVLVQDSS